MFWRFSERSWYAWTLTACARWAMVEIMDSPLNLKHCFDAIATHHRDTGCGLSRAQGVSPGPPPVPPWYAGSVIGLPAVSGSDTGIDIYIVSDPEWRRMFEALFDEHIRQRANAAKPQPTNEG